MKLVWTTFSGTAWVEHELELPAAEVPICNIGGKSCVEIQDFTRQSPREAGVSVYYDFLDANKIDLIRDKYFVGDNRFRGENYIDPGVYEKWSLYLFVGDDGYLGLIDKESITKDAKKRTISFKCLDFLSIIADAEMKNSEFAHEPGLSTATLNGLMTLLYNQYWNQHPYVKRFTTHECKTNTSGVIIEETYSTATLGINEDLHLYLGMKGNARYVLALKWWTDNAPYKRAYYTMIYSIENGVVHNLTGSEWKYVPGADDNLTLAITTAQCIVPELSGAVWERIPETNPEMIGDLVASYNPVYTFPEYTLKIKIVVAHNSSGSKTGYNYAQMVIAGDAWIESIKFKDDATIKDMVSFYMRSHNIMLVQSGKKIESRQKKLSEAIPLQLQVVPIEYSYSATKFSTDNSSLDLIADSIQQQKLRKMLDLRGKMLSNNIAYKGKLSTLGAIEINSKELDLGDMFTYDGVRWWVAKIDTNRDNGLVTYEIYGKE